MAGWIKTSLGREVVLVQGDIVLDGDPAPKKGHSSPPPLFGPCLLWPNGWMDRDATWYGGRSRPTPHVLDGDPVLTYPRKGHSSPPPLFSPYLLWLNGRMDQDVLDGPSFPQNQMVAHLTYCRALVAQLTVKCPVTLQCAATFLPPQKLLLHPSEVGSPMSHMVPTA